MALSITTRNAYPLKRLIFSSRSVCNRLLCTHQNRLISLESESDAIDDFTTQLIQKKTDQWETKKVQRYLNDNQDHSRSATKCNVIVQHFDLQELNSTLQDALEVDNKESVTKSIEWCIKNQQVPKLSILLQVFSLYSHVGNKNMVLKLIELCNVLDCVTLKQYSYFKHYLAEVTWIKGNTNEAIKIFEELYIENVFLRRRIKNMMKYLIRDNVMNRSEAVLLNIIEFAKRIAVNNKDFYILACIWKCCILSEWFTDQCMAVDLFQQNESLRKAVLNDLLHISVVALKGHRTEVVYKILELLIKYNHVVYYKHILDALFDYKACERDLRGCVEIAQWALAQGVELSSFQQEKCVGLLMSDARGNIDVKVQPKIPPKPPDYNFKF